MKTVTLEKKVRWSLKNKQLTNAEKAYLMAFLVAAKPNNKIVHVVKNIADDNRHLPFSVKRN